MSLSWLEERGATFGPVTVNGAGTARGVFAREDLPAGALVARIPDGAILSNQVAISTTPAGVLHARGDVAEGLLLTVAVLALRGDPSWAPYLGDLPSHVEGHPTGWSATVRQGIRGTNLSEFLPDLEARTRQEVAVLRRTDIGLSTLSYATWLAARTVVTSRRFSHESGSALVPFGDLLNHAPDPEVDWAWEDGAFVLTTRRAVPAGAELHDSYGSKSNTRLLLSYGFTLPDNPDEEVLLPRPNDGVLVLPRAESPRAAEVVEELGLDSARAWRRFRSELEQRLAATPEVDPSLPVDARRLIEGERAVLAGWIARADAP